MIVEVRDGPRDSPQTVLALVLCTSHHRAVHTGQIVYATKLLTEGSLDELWMKTMLERGQRFGGGPAGSISYTRSAPKSAARVRPGGSGSSDASICCCLGRTSATCTTT